MLPFASRRKVHVLFQQDEQVGAPGRGLLARMAVSKQGQTGSSTIQEASTREPGLWLSLSRAVLPWIQGCCNFNEEAVCLVVWRQLWTWGQNRGGETSRKALKAQLKASVCPYFLLGCVVTSPALVLNLPPALLLMLYLSGCFLMWYSL